VTDPAVTVDMVRRTLGALLSRSYRRIGMVDRATGDTVAVSPDLVSAPDGLLPVFLVAADAVWRDATGRSFGLELCRDPKTLLGFRAEGVSGGPFSSLMLSMMEAIEQTAGPSMLLVNDFDVLWRSVERGFAFDHSPRGRTAPSPGAR
jgi:hypothetical protein